MKKQLVSTDKNSGFIFPYVALIATIIMIVMTTTVSIYKNQVEMSVYLEQQIKLETLLQMGKTEFSNAFSNDPQLYLGRNGQIIYQYPDGRTIINYSPADATSLKINYSLQAGKFKKSGVTWIYHESNETHILNE